MTRRRLANRRASTSFYLWAQGLRFTCTASWFPDGTLAEVFLQNHKAGSAAGLAAQDSAVVASLALQFGVPLDTLRKSLMRDGRGRPTSPLATALDMLADRDGQP
jgi:hypothetical protein